MEYLIALLVALFGGAMFFKRKADKAIVDSKLALTKGRDIELKLTQDDLRKSIAEMDAGLERVKKNRDTERENTKDLTLAERRDRIKKGLKWEVQMLMLVT